MLCLAAFICAGDSLFLGGAWQTAVGTYYDTIAIGSGCDSVISTTVTVYSVPGTDGLSLELQIAVFPNPTLGSITILSNTVMEQVILRDLLGRTVLQQTLNVRVVSMDLSYFKRGIYTASIHFEDGRIKTEKIILR